MNYEKIPTELLIDALPEGIAIRKDPDLWEIHHELYNFKDPIQRWDESFREFIVRFCKELEGGDAECFRNDLALLLHEHSVKPSIECSNCAEDLEIEDINED